MRMAGRSTLVVALILAASIAPASMAQGAGPSVLLVGPAGTPGAQYQSIQAAVDASAPGDWILVAPVSTTRRARTTPAS